MKANWRMVLGVAALLLTSGCSQGSTPRATSSSTPRKAPTVSVDHSADYAKAFAYLQSFLDSWKKIGFYAAGQKYFDSAGKSQIQKQGNPVLVAGTVKSVQPYSWDSADNFMVQVELDLRFSGDAVTWGNGINTLFVTFVRSSASTPYQMTLNTGP